MSDRQTAEPSVGELVLQAPEDVWKKISKALGVRDRREAAKMADADPRSKELIVSILSGGDASLAESRQPRSFAESSTTNYPRGKGTKRVEI